MKIYFAGNAPGGECQEKKILIFTQRRLISYFFISEYYELIYFNRRDKQMLKKTSKKVEIFLDSGAFSAWSLKKAISIEEYIDFIKKNQDMIDVYANLDVIGDAKMTWRNQRLMEKAGLQPIPVYHLEDPEYYLDKCINEYEYFGLGGMAKGFSTHARQEFLDRCFNKICDTSNHFPKAKVHGFGLTAHRLMFRYPWYSVDSTSWITTGRMGFIIVPRKREGKWIYNKPPWKVAVSNKSPYIRKAGDHIDNLPPTQRKNILEYIHMKGYTLGKSEFREVDQNYKPVGNEKWFDKKPKNKYAKRTLEIIVEDGISNRYQLRDEMNTIYFLDLERSMPKWPWPWKCKSVRSIKGFEL